MEQEQEQFQLLLLEEEEEDSNNGENNNHCHNNDDHDLTYEQLFHITSKCCYTLILTLISSFLVGSWFTHVQTNLMVLPQILFYTRIGCDFLGRIITFLPAMKPKSINNLFIISVMRLLPVILFFINSSSSTTTMTTISTLSNNNDANNDDNNNLSIGKKLLYSDQLTIFLAATIAFSSGYQVTGCFQLAPELLSLQQRDRNVSKQTSLLNVAFSIAAFCGITISLLLVIVNIR